MHCAISSGLSVLQVIRNRFCYLNLLNSYESLVNTNHRTAWAFFHMKKWLAVYLRTPETPVSLVYWIERSTTQFIGHVAICRWSIRTTGIWIAFRLWWTEWGWGDTLTSANRYVQLRTSDRRRQSWALATHHKPWGMETSNWLLRF
jgi:hypothetical protein